MNYRVTEVRDSVDWLGRNAVRGEFCCAVCRAHAPMSTKMHSPDVQAAEHREEDPHEHGQRYGKDQSQELVDQVLAELKEGVAADPDFVEGVGQLGLRDHILEAHLEEDAAQP